MKKLYVGNLPFQATEEDISNWVKQAGATVARGGYGGNRGQDRGGSSGRSGGRGRY